MHRGAGKGLGQAIPVIQGVFKAGHSHDHRALRKGAETRLAPAFEGLAYF